MAFYFVDGTVGLSTNTGASWASPFQTVTQALAAAVTAADTSPTIACGSTGSFTANAAITWTPPANGKVAIISAINNATGTVITPAAGATEMVGAATAAFSVAAAASAAVFVSGMTMKGGTNSSGSCIISLLSTNVAARAEFTNCAFDLPTSGAASIGLGYAGLGGSQQLYLESCTFNRSGSNGAPYFSLIHATVSIINPVFSFTGATHPAELITQPAGNNGLGRLIISDGDISAFTGTALVLLTNLGGQQILFQNLKISATPAIASGAWPAGNLSITLRNVDSGNTTYTFEYLNAYGTLSANGSVFAASGAAFSGSGVSWKIVTTAATNSYSPFILPPLAIWGATLTAQTGTIQVAQASGSTALTDQQLWSDIDFSASASFPNYSWGSNRNAAPITGTGANQPTSAVSWTGLTTPVTQQLQNGFSAAAAGLLQSRISVGIASTTLYVDPTIGGVT